MKARAFLYLGTMLVLMSVGAQAQFYDWSTPWTFFGPEQVNFNQSVRQVMFAWNDHESPHDKEALKADAEWFKAHPNIKIYIDGYASSRGTLIYNLVLSQKRADYVKKFLIEAGVPPSQIVMATGWGQLYPVCPGTDDACWSQNRRVRFEYAGN
ncbi:MAG TPA: OmpA family protein [Terriglobales bacterium]|nr:OmpA family protein [Terriglobales bacterium]